MDREDLASLASRSDGCWIFQLDEASLELGYPVTHSNALVKLSAVLDCAWDDIQSTAMQLGLGIRMRYRATAMPTETFLLVSEAVL